MLIHPPSLIWGKTTFIKILKVFIYVELDNHTNMLIPSSLINVVRQPFIKIPKVFIYVELDNHTNI